MLKRGGFCHESIPHYGLRKLSVGVASVLLGTTMLLGVNSKVHADTNSQASSVTATDNTADQDSNAVSLRTNNQAQDSVVFETTINYVKNDGTSVGSSVVQTPLRRDYNQATAAYGDWNTSNSRSVVAETPIKQADTPVSVSSVKPGFNQYNQHLVLDVDAISKLAPGYKIASPTDFTMMYWVSDQRLSAFNGSISKYNVDIKLEPLEQTNVINYKTEDGTAVTSSQITGLTDQKVNLQYTAPGGFSIVSGQDLPTSYTFTADNKPIDVLVKVDSAAMSGKVTYQFIDDDDNYKSVGSHVVNGNVGNRVSLTDADLPINYELIDGQTNCQNNVLTSDGVTVQVHLHHKYLYKTEHSVRHATMHYLYAPSAGQLAGKQVFPDDVLETYWILKTRQDLVTGAVQYEYSPNQYISREAMIAVNGGNTKYTGWNIDRTRGDQGAKVLHGNWHYGRASITSVDAPTTPDGYKVSSSFDGAGRSPVWAYFGNACNMFAEENPNDTQTTSDKYMYYSPIEQKGEVVYVNSKTNKIVNSIDFAAKLGDTAHWSIDVPSGYALSAGQGTLPTSAIAQFGGFFYNGKGMTVNPNRLVVYLDKVATQLVTWNFKDITTGKLLYSYSFDPAKNTPAEVANENVVFYGYAPAFDFSHLYSDFIYKNMQNAINAHREGVDYHQTLTLGIVPIITVVTAANNAWPGSKLSPSAPYVYPAGVSPADLLKTITRTINVIDPDGSKQVVKQTVKFERVARWKSATDEVTYSDWVPVGSNGFEAFVPEAIDGYKSSTVSSQSVNVNDKDSTVNVVYEKVATNQPKYVDNTGKFYSKVPAGYHLADKQAGGASQLILKNSVPSVSAKAEFVTRTVKIELPNGKVRTIRQKVMKGKKFGNVRLPKLRGYHEVVTGGDLTDNTAVDNVTITVKFVK